MNRSSVLIAVLVVGLVTIGIAAMPAHAYETPDDACNTTSNDQAIVVALQTDDVENSDLSLHTDVTFKVYVCDNQEAQERGDAGWTHDTDDVGAIELVGETSHAIEMQTVEDESDNVVDLATLIEYEDEALPSFTLTVFGDYERSADHLDEDLEVTFRDADTATAFDDAVRNYSDSIADAREVIADLEAYYIDDATLDHEAMSTRDAAMASRNELEAAFDSLSEVLAEETSRGDEGAAAAVFTTNDNHTAMQQNLSEAIDDIEATAEDEILMPTVMAIGAGLGGILAGAVIATPVGIKLSNRRLYKLRRHRRRKSDFDYRLTQLKVPLLLAIMLSLTAGGLLVVAELYVPLGRVIL